MPQAYQGFVRSVVLFFTLFSSSFYPALALAPPEPRAGIEWQVKELAPGLTWQHAQFFDRRGQEQQAHILNLDLKTKEVQLAIIGANGCESVPEIGLRLEALAGINGGFFASGCASVSLLKIAGKLLATNAKSRGSFGLGSQGPLLQVIAKGQDWPEVDQALGGGPMLIINGRKTSQSDWNTEGFNPSYYGAHPRTWLALTDAGQILLGVIDGRRPTAAGMTLEELQQWIADRASDIRFALNLDGGGSSTLWIAGEGGVVNQPSDGQPRKVAHGIFLLRSTEQKE